MFNNIDSLWGNALALIMAQGRKLESRVGDTLEIVGYSAAIEDIGRAVLMNPIRRFSSAYAAAELLWYLSGTNDAAAMLAYAPSYANYCERKDDGTYTAFGAYGWRMRANPGFAQKTYPGSDQFGEVIRLLREKPSTRQAVISLWDSGDLPEAVAGRQLDLPCTIALQFLVRDRRVHCIAYMRSNDVWLGMPYDVFCFTGLQRIVADELGLEYGSYTHHVGSVHLYQKNHEAAVKALDYWNNNYNDLGTWSRSWAARPLPAAGNAVELEREVRRLASPGIEASMSLRDWQELEVEHRMVQQRKTMLHDCVLACAAHLHESLPVSLISDSGLRAQHRGYNRSSNTK
jgi:thymidylate synthase